MSSTIFINYSPDSNAPPSEGSGDQTSSPVRQTETGRWEKLCPDCEGWIGLGPKGGEHSFTVHQGSKRCGRIQQLNINAQRNAVEEHEYSFDIHPSPTSPIVQTASSSIAESPTSPSHGPTHTAKLPSPSFPPITTAPTIHPPQLPCGGVRYKWELGDACRTYPFQYHATGIPTWIVRTAPPGLCDEFIELESRECTGFRDPSMEACLSCTNVPNSPEFKNVLWLASRDPTPDTPYIHLSWAQAYRRLRELNEDVIRARRKVKWFSELAQIDTQGLTVLY